jgi:ATP-binding cassette subfamily F protein uup
MVYYIVVDQFDVGINLSRIYSIEALSEALCNWGDKDGAVIIVSHDKAFCDTIGFTHVGTVMNGGFIIEERGLRPSDWDIYNLEADDNATDESKIPVVTSDQSIGAQRDYKDVKKSRTDKKNIIRKLERDIEKIETEIKKLKEKKDSIQVEMDNRSNEGWSILADLSNKMNIIDEEIEIKESRWLEYSDQLEYEIKDQ